MTDEIKNNQVNDDEIDLIALAKTIWNGRKFIIKTVLIFMCIGLAVALLSPKEYTASTTMVPQIANSSSKMGGLSSLAAMAGFNLNDLNKNSGDLSPYIYPQIVQSVPFQLELMNTTFTFSDVDHPLSIYEYYTEYYKPGILSYVKKYTIGLPFLILGALKPKAEEELPVTAVDSSSPIYLSQEQEDVRKILENGVRLETNDKDGYVSLHVISGQAKLAAEMAQKAQQLLQQYITTFKIEKASAQLSFIEERYHESKGEFEATQTALASFRDKNKNVTSARARTQEERLQSDYQLAFEVYSQLAQQMEQARIQVKEDTPVFSIIKPVTVPLEKSKPNKPMILIIWTFLGGIIAIGWIFGKEFLANIKTKWNEE